AGRAFLHDNIDERLDAVVLHLVDDRADVDGLIERRTHTQRLHAYAHLLVQLLRDALLHQQPRARATHLSLVEPDAVYKAFYSGVEVRVVEDDERRLAAKLQ